MYANWQKKEGNHTSVINLLHNYNMLSELFNMIFIDWRRTCIDKLLFVGVFHDLNSI